MKIYFLLYLHIPHILQSTWKCIIICNNCICKNCLLVRGILQKTLPCRMQCWRGEEKGKGRRKNLQGCVYKRVCVHLCTYNAIAELFGLFSVSSLKHCLFHSAPGSNEEYCLGLMLTVPPSCQIQAWKIRDTQSLPLIFGHTTMLRGQDWICKAKLEHVGNSTPFLVCLLGYWEERAGFV